MAKVTPEFKRALRHFINQAVYGEYWLLDDSDVARIYGTLCGRKNEAASMVHELDAWRTGLWQGLRWAFELLPDERADEFISDVKELDADEAVELDAQWLPLHIGGILGELTDDMDKWERLLMEPCDAMERAYKARAYDMLLKHIRGIDEREHDERATTPAETYPEGDPRRYPLTPEVQAIMTLAVSACRYWNAREANRLGYGDVKPLYAAVELGHGERRTGPVTVAVALAMFCNAYSHGIDPLTGRRPQLPRFDSPSVSGLSAAELSRYVGDGRRRARQQPEQ